jgi:hypothetical protein
MKRSVKIISRPAKINLCHLLYASATGNLGTLVPTSHYLIEDNKHIVAIYARNDADMYRKLSTFESLSDINPTIPPFLEHNYNTK